MTLAQFMDALNEVPGLNEKAEAGTGGVMTETEILAAKEEFVAKYMVK
jgi:hypothetical protein